MQQVHNHCYRVSENSGLAYSHIVEREIPIDSSHPLLPGFLPLGKLESCSLQVSYTDGQLLH